MKPFVPSEFRRYCAIPIANEPDIVWDEIISNFPSRFSNDKQKFVVKYDSRNPKPACLEPYNDYSFDEAKVIGATPGTDYYTDESFV